MTRSALDVVTTYIEEVWNHGRTELVPELCADPITRHDANSVTQLNHAEQQARIAHNFSELKPTFENVILAGDDRHITLVWNVVGRDPSWKLCGVEIFRVVDGKITEVWNSPYVDGRWGLSRALSGSEAGTAPIAFPIMSAEIGETGGEMVVPVDARNIGRWIERLLGRPTSAQGADGLWHHRFAGTGRAALPPLALTLSDVGQAPIVVPATEVVRIGCEVARSGLINATITTAGTPAAAAGETPTPQPAAKVTRLAETFGTLDRAGDIVGRVVDASIAFGPDGKDASGRVSIRLAGSSKATDAAGQGRLTLGWRHGDFSLGFEVDAALTGPLNSFEDQDEVEASFEWRGDTVVATLINDLAGRAEG